MQLSVDPMAGWSLTGSWGGTPLPLAIGIIELRAKTGKIFGFRGVIWKIFWNKDLARFVRFAHTNEKRCGSNPHPYSCLCIYSIKSSQAYPNNFPSLFSLSIHRVTGKVAKMGA